MKHMKKALALVLVLIMVFSLNITAFAADTDDYVVTVYVTTGMFTTGGFDPDHGHVIPNADPEDYLIYGYEPFPADGLSIAWDLSEYRSCYYGPSTMSDNVNVLDAIVFSLMMNGFTCSGGWDTVNSPAGGYISNVYPGYAQTVYQTQEVIGGVTYVKTYGNSWRIAVKGPNDTDYQALTIYGTSVTIEDGMEIIFDYSPYIVYSLPENN